MKESPFGIMKSPVFREVFDSEQGVRSRNGTPTAVTFSNGVASLNGTSSYIKYAKSLNGTYSVRVKLTSLTIVNNSFLVDFRNNTGVGEGYLQFNSATNLSPSSGTVYVDGVSTPTCSNNSKEFIITGISLSCFEIFLAIRYSLSPLLAAGYELLEIYDYTLTANEVANI